MSVDSQRKNISQPEDWWVAFEEEASKSDMTLSAWIGDCCWSFLPVKRRKKLSGRKPAHRPPLDQDE